MARGRSAAAHSLLTTALCLLSGVHNPGATVAPPATAGVAAAALGHTSSAGAGGGRAPGLGRPGAPRARSIVSANIVSGVQPQQRRSNRRSPRDAPDATLKDGDGLRVAKPGVRTSGSPTGLPRAALCHAGVPSVCARARARVENVWLRMCADGACVFACTCAGDIAGTLQVHYAQLHGD
eukprot:COSAG01_NODE_1416_length_10373_cov_4.944984_9_plen_180_part_00